MSDELEMRDYDPEWVTQFGSPEQKATMARDLEAQEQEMANMGLTSSGEQITPVDPLPDGQWDGGDSYELEPLKSLEQRKRDEIFAHVDDFVDEVYANQPMGEPVDDLTNDLYEAGFIDDGPDYELEPLEPKPERASGSGSFEMGGHKYETNEKGDWRRVLPDGSHGDPVTGEKGKIHYFDKKKKPGFVTGRGPNLAHR